MKNNTIPVEGLPPLPDGYNGATIKQIEKGDMFFCCSQKCWVVADDAAFSAYRAPWDIVAIPEIKIIDMSAAIESGVDCEFTRGGWGDPRIDALRSASRAPYVRRGSVACWDKCRIRQNHIHYHDGRSKSPIPDGLKITAYHKDRSSIELLVTGGDRVNWQAVFGYKVLGPAPGYKYKWEVEVDE